MFGVRMEITDTEIDGLYIINAMDRSDNRGSFVKMFNKDRFLERGLDVNFVESYYSISKKNVIRGMHFQIPPYDHNKLVYVSYGKIIDVVLDLRKESKTYGRYMSFVLSSENKKTLFIPKGCAHGFKSVIDNSIVTYLQTTVYNSESDKGVSFNSFGFDWECEEAIVSKRDLQLPGMDKFTSPF